MKYLPIVLLLFAAIFGGRSHAAEPDEEIVTVSTIYSLPGQPKDVFVRQVAGYLNEWTTRNKVEACGYIAVKFEDGVKTYGVVLGTIGSQLKCNLQTNRIPKGFMVTNETIHSHPNADPLGRVRLTAESKRMSNLPTNIETVRVGVKDFSLEDYHLGAGYVTAGGRLLYQDGSPGSRRDLGPIGSP